MVMVIQIKNHIVAGLRPIGTGQSARESCILVENSCKITPTNSLKVGFQAPPPPSVLEGS